MVASTNPGCLQTMFNMLTGIFNQVGLQTNVQKNVGIVRQPCQEFRVRADKAYKHQMAGEGRSYQYRQQERVQFPE